VEGRVGNDCLLNGAKESTPKKLGLCTPTFKEPSKEGRRRASEGGDLATKGGFKKAHKE